MQRHSGERPVGAGLTILVFVAAPAVVKTQTTTPGTRFCAGPWAPPMMPSESTSLTGESPTGISCCVEAQDLEAIRSVSQFAQAAVAAAAVAAAVAVAVVVKFKAKKPMKYTADKARVISDWCTLANLPPVIPGADYFLTAKLALPRGDCCSVNCPNS